MPRPFLIISVILFIVSFIALTSVLLVWIGRYRHTKERFAIVSLITVLCITLSMLTVLSTSMMPWHLSLMLYQTVRGSKINIPVPQWSEYLLLFLIYFLFIQFIIRAHRRWDGLKSIEEYQREQRSESISFWSQGINELHRIIKGLPPPKPYFKDDSKQFIAQLESVTDSLAWKDQARDLIRLSSSSYSFDPDSSWHDKDGYWVGRNIDTNDLVFLYPSQSRVSTVEQNAFVSYAHRFATERGKEQYELIIALKEGDIEHSNVQFSKRIRFETESSLLNNLVDFTDYLNEIRRRVVINNLPDSNLSLNDVYVPSHYFRGNDRVSSDNLEAHLFLWLQEPSQRQIALLGEYGQGKSTAALMLTHHILSQHESQNTMARIPILIELRGTSPRNLTPLQMLGAWAAQYNINPQALLKLHIAGRLLLIFEGFDEMALVGDAEMRLKHFKTLWQFCYPKAKILITGRPNFFLDEEEMKAALGISKPMGDRPYCEAIRIAPFNVEQISESLRNQKPLVKDQICSLAAKNSRFLELVSRPSLLHIVSVLWEKEQLSEKIERLNSAYIMDLFVRHSYRRQGLKEVDGSEFMALTSPEREYFMTGIATYMAANQLPNQITKAQLNDLVENLIASMPDSISTESPAITGESTRPLHLRLQNTEHGVEHVKTDVRACGLLVDDPAALGTFRFGHKSFMEFLFAALLADYIQTESPIKARAIMKVTNAKIDDILGLPVALDFLSELLGTTVKDNLGRKSNQRDQMREAVEYSIASRLLKTILSEGGMILPVQRFFIFNDVYTISARKLGEFKGISLMFLSPSIFFTIMPMIFFMYYTFPLFRRPDEKDILSFAQSNPFFFLLLLGGTSMAMMMMMAIQRRPGMRRKLALWTYICEGVGIKSCTMHRVVGTWVIPWAKDKNFDFYKQYLEKDTNI